MALWQLLNFGTGCTVTHCGKGYCIVESPECSCYDVTLCENAVNRRSTNPQFIKQNESEANMNLFYHHAIK